MKIVESTLEQKLAGGLEANLNGLTEKHARQMHKKAAGSVKKLAQSFARLLAKEQHARDKQQRQATKASVETLVLKLHKVFAALAAPHLRRAAASS